MGASITTRAPGKLIISGEHAVVHGAPALAMAVQQYATTTVSRHLASSILFDLFNLKYKKSHTIERLRKIKHRLQNAYLEFQNGHCQIREVLEKPFELLQY